MSMFRTLLAAAALLLLTAAAAQAQTDGFSVEVGPSFITKSGSVSFGTGALQSDAGWAIRGRLRYGMGALAIAGEIQASNQKYGSSGTGLPSDLNSTYLGVAAMLRPIKLGPVEPYAELGIGRLSFKDDLIATGDDSKTASTYGLGVLIAPGGRIAFDADLRVLRQTDLQFGGIGSSFKYDPKVFTAMILIKL
jgi:opacity protein-like surface antigen